MSARYINDIFSQKKLFMINRRARSFSLTCSFDFSNKTNFCRCTGEWILEHPFQHRYTFSFSLFFGLFH